MQRHWQSGRDTQMKCPKSNKGPDSNSWKGGRHITSHGYITVYAPEHPFADHHGHVYEHRIVMEQKLERYLTVIERIHHINGVKSDNRLENLKLCSCLAEHRSLHRLELSNRKRFFEPNDIRECACGCGKTFPQYDGHNRPRRFVHGHQWTVRWRNQDAKMPEMRK